MRTFKQQIKELCERPTPQRVRNHVAYLSHRHGMTFHEIVEFFAKCSGKSERACREIINDCEG